MKIQRLDLLAFGPFTRQSIDLSAGEHGLHIIYGPNEAGKSSSLRALEQLLYGIPVNSTDNFIHHHKNMRIGGLLKHSDGTQLGIIRRKAKTQDLRDEKDSEPIDESVLEKLLDGCNQPYFRKMFGLSHMSLVSGGESLFKGTGELGEILFSAGAGVTNVSRIAEKLTERAEALFLPTGTRPQINTNLAALKAIQSEQKELEVPAAEWESLDEALRTATAQRDKVDATLSDKDQTLKKLQRVKAALPAVAQRIELVKFLDSLTEAPLLPADFADNSRKYQSELKNNLANAENIERKVAELEKDLEPIEIPEGLIERSSVIEDLQLKLGSHQKASNDRSGLMVRLSQLREAIKIELQNLGQEPELSLCDQLRITVQERSLIRELIANKSAIESRAAITSQRVRQLNESLENLQKQTGDIKEQPESEKLGRAVKRIEQMGAIESQLKTAQQQLKLAAQQLSMDLKKLLVRRSAIIESIIEKENWEQLETLAIPSAETIDRFFSEMESLTQDLSGLRKTIERLEQEEKRNAENLEQLRLQMNAPTEDDLEAARSLRDGGWDLVHREWKQGDLSDDQIKEFVSRFASETDLASAYERSVADADSLADRMRRESSQVAKKAALLAEQSNLSTKLEETKTALEEKQSQAKELQADWIASWSPLELSPLPPKEMRNWRQKFSECSSQARAMRDNLIVIDSLQEKIADSKKELKSHLKDLAPDTVMGESSLESMLENCQSALNKAETAKLNHKTLLRDIDKLQSELAAAERESQTAQSALKDWNNQWTAAVAPLKLPAGATADQANDVIDSLDKMFKNYSEAKDLGSRIKGIDRDAQEFSTGVEKVVSLVAVDLADFPAEQAAAELNVRLARARSSKEKSDLLNKEKKRQVDALQNARSTVRQCMDALDLMSREARCESYDDLLPAAENSTRRRRAQTDLDQIDKTLLTHSAGQGIDSFLLEISATDVDSIDSTMTALNTEISALREEKTIYDQAIGRSRAELDRIDGSAKAAEAAEKAEELLAKIASSAAQYARLQVASYVLSRCIERYRDKNQNPVLRRASQIFAELTLGSFSGLREELTDKNETILVGSRPGNILVNLSGMSEGTCDQAYLALRLASLEIYLESHEPLPFIVDDILVNFDDARSEATLKVLENLSAKTQVIFFSHHKHLVDLARETVNAGSLFVHELARGNAMPLATISAGS